MGIGIGRWRFSHRLALWMVKGRFPEDRGGDCFLSVRTVNLHRDGLAALRPSK